MRAVVGQRSSQLVLGHPHGIDHVRTACAHPFVASHPQASAFRSRFTLVAYPATQPSRRPCVRRCDRCCSLDRLHSDIWRDPAAISLFSLWPLRRIQVDAHAPRLATTLSTAPIHLRTPPPLSRAHANANASSRQCRYAQSAARRAAHRGLRGARAAAHPHVRQTRAARACARSIRVPFPVAAVVAPTRAPHRVPHRVTSPSVSMYCIRLCRSVEIIRFFMLLTLPVAWPISKVHSQELS